MNNLYAAEFTKQALQNGVPHEKVASLLARAEQIAKRKPTNIKQASAKINIVDNLIAEAGLAKTASSVSYVEGVLNEAFTNGANLPQALTFTKQALAATSERVKFMEKVSSIANNPKLNKYAEGFMETAKQAGLSQDESLSLLVDLVDREKMADGGNDMFKKAPGADAGAGGPPPGMDPSAGAGASDPQEAQVLQLLQSLPPEEQQQIIQQLLAAISGGGPGAGAGAGAGAGGPPPGAGPGAGPGGPQ